MIRLAGPESLLRTVSLHDTGTTTSVIGFGCGSVLGRFGRRDSLRALHSAYDRGIRYFDVARSYGFGEAETLLGGFLRGRRRSEVCLTTKFGILPPRHRLLLRMLKPIARKALSIAPVPRDRLKSTVVRVAPVSTGNFDVVTARRSLEQSLAALQTDYVDFYLLHSCQPEDLNDDELFAFLDECVERGLVRHIGVSYEGFDLERLLPLSRSGLKLIQVPLDVRDHRRVDLLNAQEAAVVTHSPFGGGPVPARILEFATASEERKRSWSERLGIDVSAPGMIGKLMLSHAIEFNLRGVVLCSMHSESHLGQNVECAESRQFSEEVLLGFRELVDEYSHQVEKVDAAPALLRADR